MMVVSGGVMVVMLAVAVRDRGGDDDDVLKNDGDDVLHKLNSQKSTIGE